MNRFRILLLSNTRPSRAWKIAARLAEEIGNGEICGLVQRPLRTLSQAEQVLAAGCESQRRWTVTALHRLLHAALWCVHGCPRNVNKPSFTVERLAEEFGSAGLPFLLAENLGEERVADFIRKRCPDLIIVLGDFCPQTRWAQLSSHGLISAVVREIKGKEAEARDGREITIEHREEETEQPAAIARVTLPSQPYDTFPEVNLKSDLVADDLLLQTAIHLERGDIAATAAAVARWADGLFSPYLRRLEPDFSEAASATNVPRRSRSLWKLCVETLLCSPLTVGRNWWRRLRGRYPVLILAHHLVSDRPHRMGVSTAHFWRQIRFLQKHYRFVSLCDAIKLLRSGKVRVPTLALTFDDGYLDNFLSLRAVAEEAGIPIAHFVVSDPVEEQREFQHDLEAGITGAFPLTWEQIRYWNARGAEIGSHTRTHFDCGSIDSVRLEEEIVESKTGVEAHIKSPVRFFAFPFGKQENISPLALEVAQSAYTHVLSCFGGENLPNRAASHRHLLRKNHYHHPWELELELQSVFDLVNKMKQVFRVKRVQADYAPAKSGIGGAIPQPEMPAAD